MFRKKGGGGGGGPDKQRPARQRGGNLSQFGLMDVGGVDSMGNLDSMLDEDDDDDLEAELATLVGGGGRKLPSRPIKKKPEVDLDAMVASCMRDYDSQEELSDSEDPDLLAELQDLDVDHPSPHRGRQEEDGRDTYAGASLLFTIQERMLNYRQAEEVAKLNGETSRARRFARGLTTLKELEQQVKAGRPVSDESIPPVVSVGKRKELETISSGTGSSEMSPITEDRPLPPLPPPIALKEAASPAEPRRAPPPPPQRISPTLMSPANAAAPPPPVPPRLNPAPQPPAGAVRVLPVSAPTPQSIATHISSRRNELKVAALSAKQAGNKALALDLMRAIKQCDAMLEQEAAGAQVDISVLPSVEQIRVSTLGVSEAAAAAQQTPAVILARPETELLQTSRAEVARTFSRDEPVQMPEKMEDMPVASPEMFGAPPLPTTIKEALHQRLDKYKAEEAKAKSEGNSSKARRMGRIVTQYQDAMKLHAAGRPIPRGELPDPPGFGPIPLQDPPSERKLPPPAAAVLPAAPAAAAAVPVPMPTAAPGASPTATKAASPSAPHTKAVSPQPPPMAAGGGGKVQRQVSMMSVQDEQLLALEKRQKLFKEAALQAKQQGQTDNAREYLKQALAFNKLIEVSRAGLPVDMTTLPVPPQMQVKVDMDFEIVSREDSQVTGDREEMYSNLEKDLIAQVKMCMTNRAYFKEVGDISSSNKFEQMALHSKKDLDAVRFAFKRGDPVPRFHYETRAFSKVVSNTDLTDNDLELSIISGINYVVKNPKDVDTYVKWEFPFPKETPVVDKTHVVKDSNNPAYDAVFKLVVNPRDKTFARVVKRNALKVEVWCKGGFLRSDTLLGTATVKLAQLETHCQVHDCFDLYEGRKPVGGKVEVKLRLRNPVVSKQIEQAQEKWLVVSF